MSIKITRTPNSINQTSGSNYVMWSGYNNLKTTSAGTYAITSNYIQGKSFPLNNRPAIISVSNFKAKIPSNAVVKKIVVHYRHSRRAVCARTGNTVTANNATPCPASSTLNRCNIPAPTISILNTNLSKKGQAPYAKINKKTYGKLANTLTFENLYLDASVVNSSNFGVKINYPKNSNEQIGYVLLNYLYVDIYYDTPSFTLTAQDASGDKTYNKSEYHLRVNLSDKNTTRKGSNINISLPSGLSYTGFKGNGKITTVGASGLIWVPDMKASSASVELVFDVNVSFAQGSDYVSKSFGLTLVATGWTGTHTVTVYKELPPEKQIEGEDSKQSFTDDDAKPEVSPMVWGILDTAFKLNFEFTEEEIERYNDGIGQMPLKFVAYSENGTLSQNWYYSNENNVTGARLDNSTWDRSYEEDNYVYEDYFKVRNNIGVYTLKCYASVGGILGSGAIVELVRELKIYIKPQESSLTTPNFTILQPSEEECNRLGTGYGYTVQSDMKLYGYTEYYNDSTTNSLTYVSSSTHVTTKADGGPVSRPAQFTYEFDFKTTSTDARVFLAGESLEGKGPLDFPRNSISLGTIDGKLAAHMAGDTGVEVIEGDTATLDTYYHMKIEYDGTELSCYVDDTLLGTFSNCNWMKNLTDIYFSLFIMETGTVYCKDRLMWYGEGESYVRDWYKNFRIGVFNNPIYSNITSYYQYDSTDTQFDGYFTLPPIYDLTGASLTVTTNHSIILNEETVTSSKTYTALPDYNIPVNFQKVNDDNVILTMTLTTTGNETWSKALHINFNAEEDTNIQEITTDTTDYDNLTNQQIIENAEYWATETAGLNTTNIVECEFTYNKNYPLYILITGDYPESDYYTTNTLTFTEPEIVETTVYEPNKPNGNYPIPIDTLVLQDTSSSEITLNPYTTAETIVFYQLPLDDHYGTDTEKAIRGIELTGEIEQANTLVLSAKLKSPTGDSRERSIVINEEALTDGTNNFSMGGNGDLWGFNTLDIVEFEDWEIEFTINNSLEETDSSINFGNVRIILYIEQVDQQNIKAYIDGQDIAYYGVFLTDVKIPEGLETDTAYLSVDGTDINDAYRQNIREKEIQIEFDIGDGCSLEAATLSLREFAKLLVNDRDEYNRPIPKRIEFSHYPDVYWEYVMEKGLESEININTYEVKAKLTVPAGTSYDKVNTTTSNTGYVNGLASINPTLIVKPTSETITIRETISGQEFHIGYTGGWDDKILEIDCEDRICWMKTSEEDTDPVNLNRYIDYNSDWFVLKEDYAFEGVNCVIRTVDYAERW